MVRRGLQEPHVAKLSHPREQLQGGAIGDRLSTPLPDASGFTTASGSSTAAKLASDWRKAPGLPAPRTIGRLWRLSLRNQFSVVLQEPVLFSTSVAANITYARPEASAAEVEAAARAECAHDFIADLPEGYETNVGERGMGLSGGERQRISLARAFLKDAPLLVLDEPTSSVDAETEAQIIDALNRLMNDRTTFVIAHRTSTLVHCDAQLNIENGRIVKGNAHSSEIPSISLG